MHVVYLAREFSDGEAISKYCKSIANELVERGDEATIVAFDNGSHYSVKEDIDVRRVPMNFDGSNIFNWAMMLNNQIKGEVSRMLDEKDVEIIHANDWATVPGGITLSKHLEVPLIITIHSTENQRGFEGQHASMISELEWKGGFEADKVLATNENTKNSLLFDLDVPEDKIVLANPYMHDWQQIILNLYEEVQYNKATSEIR